MNDLAFDPPQITIGPGEQVRLELANLGSMAHDFSVDTMPVVDVRTVRGTTSGGQHNAHGGNEPAVHLALEPGTGGSIELGGTEAGRYEYYCSIEGHRQAGMAGVIIVQ